MDKYKEKIKVTYSSSDLVPIFLFPVSSHAHVNTCVHLCIIKILLSILYIFAQHMKTLNSQKFVWQICPVRKFSAQKQVLFCGSVVTKSFAIVTTIGSLV